MDSYIKNQVDNNEGELSEFILKDRKDTSVSLLINLNVQSEKVDTNASNDSINNDRDDEWCETTKGSPGVMDTLSQELGIIQDRDRIISFASGEGSRPLIYRQRF